jgi:hypothetical protein
MQYVRLPGLVRLAGVSGDRDADRGVKVARHGPVSLFRKVLAHHLSTAKKKAVGTVNSFAAPGASTPVKRAFPGDCDIGLKGLCGGRGKVLNDGIEEGNDLGRLT